jgi:sulfonate transport system permease protein
MKIKVAAAIQGLVIPTGIIAFWSIGSPAGWWPSNILPNPADIGAFVVQSAGDGSLIQHVAATLARLLLGFLLGLAAALVLATLCGLSSLTTRFIDPTIQALRAIPSLAWVPLFLIWLGIGESSKIVLIAVGVFFPIYLNLLAGFRGVDRKLVEVGRTLGFHPVRIITSIVLPATLPFFLTGIRGGLGLGWMFVVAAELLGASQGLGFLLDYGRNISRPDIIIASIVLFAVIGKATDAVLATIEKRALRWQDAVKVGA